MHTHIYLLTISLPLLTVLLIFGMKYFAATLSRLESRTAAMEQILKQVE
jgi:hypothetical protein